MRDFDKQPYTPEERRIVEYIVKNADVGGGDDPIGFILASHAYLIAERNNELDETAATPYCSRCGYPCMRCNGGR